MEVAMIDLRLSDLLEGFPEPLLLCDEDGLVVTANSAAKRLFRRGLPELREAPADTWLHDSEGLLWPRLGDSVSRELVFRDISGNPRSVRGTMNQLPVDGALGWMVRLEEPRGVVEKLAGVESVAGGIADQLGGHVGRILQNAHQLLLEGLEETPAAQARGILEAAEAAAKLQRQLRAVAGQGAEREPARLARELRECEPLLESVLGPEIRLKVRYETDHDDVRLDRRAFRLALVRLAEWIVAQEPAPTTVWVSLQASPDNNARSVIRVVDDGPGLEAAAREQLFQPFALPGADLGLAVVFGVIERHEGRLLVDSTPGQGTSFNIELSNIDPLSHPPDTSISEGSETILVIEDDDATREMVCAALATQGYRVLPAANGVEASVLLRTHHHSIDFVLADAVVPGRSGIEVAAEARQLQPDLPVLLMTGYSAEFLSGQLRDDLPVLHKPFSPIELIQRLRTMLDD